MTCCQAPDRGGCRRTLIILPSRIGDAIMASGVIRHARDTWPEAVITVVASAATAPLLAEIGHVGRVIRLDKRRLKLHWLMLWPRLMARWDVVIDMRGSLVSALVPSRLRLAYTGRLRPTAPEHRVVSAGRLVGRASDPPAPLVECSPAAEAAAARLLAGRGSVLALAGGARWRGKVWPAERFVALGAALLGADPHLAGASVVVVGGRGEDGIVEPLRALVGAGRVLDLTGLDLPATFACLKRARLFVGNDSGMMHLAAAAGAPTLGLFGPSSDALFRPWGRLTAFIRGPRPPTANGRKQKRVDPAEDHLRDLTVEQVVEAAAALLDRSAPRSGALAGG